YRLAAGGLGREVGVPEGPLLVSGEEGSLVGAVLGLVLGVGHGGAASDDDGAGEDVVVLVGLVDDVGGVGGGGQGGAAAGGLPGAVDGDGGCVARADGAGRALECGGADGEPGDGAGGDGGGAA